MQLTSDENDSFKLKSLVVQYHVRGRRKRKPVTTRCHTVQEVIALAQQSFPAFAERNPWICVDSKHAAVFVGLDPEIQPPTQALPNRSTTRNLSISKESTQR